MEHLVHKHNTDTSTLTWLVLKVSSWLILLQYLLKLQFAPKTALPVGLLIHLDCIGTEIGTVSCIIELEGALLVVVILSTVFNIILEGSVLDEPQETA